MLALISPAKTLDYESSLPTDQHTQARLLEHSQELIEVASKLSATEISSLMSVSEKIANLNVERFRDWQPEFDLSNARQAIFAFKGDVYTGLDAYNLKDHDISYAQEHLRMLSGLYGLLRPLDLMMPYRLEMGTKLANSRGQSDGIHDEGYGETDDVLEVIKFARTQHIGLPFYAGGFSFGAHVMAKSYATLPIELQPKQTVLCGLPTATVAGLRHYVTPHIKGDILFLHGEADDVTLLSDLIEWAKPQRHLLTILPGANHFFTGYLKQLRIAITRFLML